MNPIFETIRKRILKGLPAISFFFFLYSIIVGLFGTRYAVVVSIFTSFFQSQRLKDHTIFFYIRLLFNSFLLCFLAYVSSFSLTFCILLNFAVPFLLVFIHSSQFNPKGYFSYAMMFVFLEMRPPTADTITLELIILAIAVTALALALQFYAKMFRRPADPWKDIHVGLGELADLMDLMAAGKLSEDTVSRLRSLELKFHTLSYSGHRFFSPRRSTVKLYDMFAILFQRASYLAANTSWKNEVDQAHMEAIHRLALYVKKVQEQISPDDNQALISEARELLNGMHLTNGRLRIFFRSFLHMMILILKDVTEPVPIVSSWQKTSLEELAVSFLRRCSPESFEIRFATRLSVLMTVSYTISYLVDITHSYWLPMNAFIMLMPAYEESDKRARTRPVGTAIGCVLMYLILPHLTSTVSQFIFALANLSIMYCATPGTWNHPIFSTCYALTLTSMSIPQNTAISVRLICVLAAMVLVFAVNHCVFSTSRNTLFRLNIHQMFRLHNAYWDIIRRTITGWADLSIAREILTYFYMVYGEAFSYINQQPSSPQKEMDRRALITMWQVFSELEQIEFLLQLDETDEKDQAQLLRLATECQRHFTKGNTSPLPARFEQSEPGGGGSGPDSGSGQNAGSGRNFGPGQNAGPGPDSASDLAYVADRYLANARAVSEAFARFA